MKRICSGIVNFVVLLIFVGIYGSFFIFIYNNKPLAFIVIFILLLLLSIVKCNIKNLSADKNPLIHFLNGIIIGYKISLVFFVVFLGKETFNSDINYNTYFMCYIPSILYIFDSNNLNEIIEFCNYDLFY